MRPAVSASLQAADGRRYDVLGELGADERGPAYLARENATNALVALQLTEGSGAESVAVHRVLGTDVPGRGVRCPMCAREVAAWSRYCHGCGGDLGVPLVGADAAAVLEQVLSASSGYEVLGEIPRADGGPAVRFARERGTGEVVALALTPRDQGKSAGRNFEVTTTRLAAISPGAPEPQPEAAGSGMVCPTCGTEYPPDARFCVKDGLALQPREPRSDLIGQIVAGRYQLLRKLGEGGMGGVYLAEQIKMGRKCAIKILHRDLARNPESVARFSREAREAGRLDHPNVVQIHDFGEDESGRTYLAMEYVEGLTLARILHDAGPLPIARALALASQVAEALVAAHAAGLVHRDIKPENILVTARRDGSELVKVVDFGIAKAIHHDGFDTLTRTGVAVGTSRYMSPEQLIADPVDGRTDIYGCGCVLWEMLVGHPLWQGGAQEFVRRLQQAAPRVREEAAQVPEALDELVARTLEPRPENRVSTALELRDGLESLLDGMSAGSRGPFRSHAPGALDRAVGLGAARVQGPGTGQGLTDRPRAEAPTAPTGQPTGKGAASEPRPSDTAPPPSRPPAAAETPRSGAATPPTPRPVGATLLPPAAAAAAQAPPASRPTPRVPGTAARPSKGEVTEPSAHTPKLTLDPAVAWVNENRRLAAVIAVAGMVIVIGFLALRPSEHAGTGVAANPSAGAPGQLTPSATPTTASPPAAPQPGPASEGPPAHVTPPAPTLAKVRLLGDLPPHAELRVDGKPERRREFQHSLSLMRITVRAPGYVERQLEATVLAGENKIEIPPLQRLAGTALSAQARPPAGQTGVPPADSRASAPASTPTTASPTTSPASAGSATPPPAPADPAARFQPDTKAFVRRFADAVSSGDPEQVRRVLGLAASSGGVAASLDSTMHALGKVTARAGIYLSNPTGSPPTVRFNVNLANGGILLYEAAFLFGKNGWAVIQIRRI